MLSPVKVVDIELSQPLQTLNDLVGYIRVQVLVRLHGVPLGELSLPVINGQCQAHDLGQAVLEKYSWAIVTTQLKNDLHSPIDRHHIDLSNLLTSAPALPAPPQYVTVAICTRDRPADLQLCLEALCGLASEQSRPIREILVVDNAPSNHLTQQLVTQQYSQYPQVRYVCEPRPGLNWARNRAIVEAAGEIIAFADDDVVVDGGWVTALARVFAEQPEVMAVTGLVRPYELETDAQVLFEMNGGFGKGFERKQYYVPKGEKMPWYLLGTGNMGTGANMAYRRSVFTTIGGFNPALDVGTITNGAGDLEMFFRILKTGHTLVYEPSALIWHRHRREYAKLRSQLYNNGSVYAYFACAAQAYPDEALSFLRLGVLWFLSWHCRRAVTLAFHPTRFPHDLAWAELTGCLNIGGRYAQSSKNARQLAEKFATADRATELQALFPDRRGKATPIKPDRVKLLATGVAVRSVELTQPLEPILDVDDYATVRVFVHWQGSGLGHVDIANHYQPIHRTQLIHTIVIQLWERLLWPDRQINAESRWHQTCSILRQHYLTPVMAAQTGIPATLPAHVPVSVIVGTYDRPTDLQNCLTSILSQVTPRRVEIIVIDNHPASGLTAPIVAQFPTVRLIEEPRQGVAYARNAGIIASCGEIIITTDDDVTMPAEWLEKLVAPFTRADVMGVTGNILPVELGATSQQLFESYGGLGRGFYAFEVSGDWFERSWMHVVPTWELGGTANAAFRASVFSDPEIGLMDEALGPGMPSGVGEDIYLFYKILKAGHTMMYAAEANVWHRHRTTMKALRHQLYNYSKGFVSYNLTTLRRDGDWRVLLNLGFYLPMFHLRRIYDRLRGKSTYPIGLTLVEIAGNLMGPIALLRSRQQVKRLGRSAPYVTPNDDESAMPLPNQ